MNIKYLKGRVGTEKTSKRRKQVNESNVGCKR